MCLFVFHGVIPIEALAIAVHVHQMNNNHLMKGHWIPPPLCVVLLVLSFDWKDMCDTVEMMAEMMAETKVYVIMENMTAERIVAATAEATSTMLLRGRFLMNTAETLAVSHF